MNKIYMKARLVFIVLAVFYLAALFTSCRTPEPDTNNPAAGGEADKTALASDIAEAEALLESVTKSDDGDGLAAGARYAGTADYNAFQAAINAAKDVNNNAGATHAEVSAAVSALAGAKTVFTGKIKVVPPPAEGVLWNFQTDVPGWTAGDSAVAQPADANYGNGLTLMAKTGNTNGIAADSGSGHNMGISTVQNIPSISGADMTLFSAGSLRVSGNGTWGKISGYKGPYTLTICYNTTSTGNARYPAVKIGTTLYNDTGTMSDPTKAALSPGVLTVTYNGTDSPDILLKASAGIRVYSIYISRQEGSGGSGYTWATDPNLQELRAFPGAEGYGQNVSGGRGGKVVKVTTLADDATNPPAGSLRWALNQYPDDPITVVFNVSGLISLKGDLRKKRNNFTLAGQTAPGGGICIMDGKVNLGGSTNFIIRHMRFRIGTMNGDPDGKGSIGIENASDFILDHCTFGWSGEENMTIYDNNSTTIQWCIIHEGLFSSGHNKGERGYGTQWGGQTATYHHNLLAHNNTRSPRFNGARSNDLDVLIDFVNNVNYNWGKVNSCYGGDIERNTHRVNFVNNYYKPGPARPGTSSSYFIESSYASSQGTTKYALWYMSGNYMEGSANTGKNTDNYTGLNIGRYPSGTTLSQLKSDTPFTVPYPVTTETAQNAYTSVLAGAGAFPRDSVDTRIVNEVRTGTATGSGTFGTGKGIIDDPVAVGGYPTYTSLPAPTDTDGDGIPDAWETANGLNPANAADGALKTLSNVYTNLEVYLYDLTRR